MTDILLTPPATKVVVGPGIDLLKPPVSASLNEAVPPGRQFITRRWVVYATIITCLAVVIILIVMAGVLFSQNQDLVPVQAPNPPVTSQIQAPQKNIPQGFILMSPAFVYTLSFGNDLQLFTTATLGGALLWFSGNTNVLSLSDTKKDLYSSNYLEYFRNEERPWAKPVSSSSCFESTLTTTSNSNSRGFTATRTLNFASNGILSINDMNGKVIWQNTTSGSPTTDTYFLQLLDTGVLRIVNQNNKVIWEVNSTSPSAVSVYNADFTYPGNRMLNNNMTLDNGSFHFLFDTRSGQLIVRQDDDEVALWSSTYYAFTDDSLFSCAFTYYGNLILFDQNRNTVWNSETASLIPTPTTGEAGNFTSRYNMQLNEAGLLQLQYFDGSQFITYFETSTNKTNRITRLPSLPFSRSNPFALTLSSQPQIVIQSSDGKLQLVYETNGTLSLYNKELNTVSNTGTKRGESLILQGAEMSPINPALIGSLSLYPTGSSTPSWSFQPLQSIVPATQLPITLCFQTGNRLCLLTQDQEVVNALTSLQ